MYIKVTRNILHKGEHVAAGSVIEVDSETGKYLIGINKAESAEKPAKKKEEDPK